MKKLLALLLAGCLMFGLVACGGNTDGGDKDAEGDGALKVALVVSALGDKSFNDSAKEGLDRAVKDYGIALTVKEIGSETDKVEPALVNLSEEGYDVMIFNNMGFGAGAEWVENNAAKYPDTLYLVYDEVDPNNDYTVDDDLAVTNVQFLQYRASESDFLAGYLAAKLSETGIIGFVGGIQGPVISDFLVGYIQGAKVANPDVKVSIAYVGSYSDAPTGKSLGLAQIGAGADVIHAVAGSSGNGALEAALEQGKIGIGVDSDQYTVFKADGDPKADCVVTSSLKNVGESLYVVVGEVVNGTFAKQSKRWFGSEEGCSGIAKNEKYEEMVSDELRAEIEEVEAKLAAGEYTCVSYFDMTEDEFNTLVDSVK